MIKYIVVFILCLVAVLVGAFSYSTMFKDGAEETIREFYTAYINQVASDEISIEKEEAIKRKYCTKALLDQLKHEELEADPFLHSQDFSQDWVSELTVTKQDSFYVVCVPWPYERSMNCMRVFVVEQGDTWLINDVK